MEPAWGENLSKGNTFPRNPHHSALEVWLYLVQDTKRLQKEELALLDLEVMSRQRLAQATADKAAAEASGELAVARAGEKLLQLEARIDRIKQQLFFPTCKGYMQVKHPLNPNYHICPTLIITTISLRILIVTTLITFLLQLWICVYWRLQNEFLWVSLRASPSLAAILYLSWQTTSSVNLLNLVQLA